MTTSREFRQLYLPYCLQPLGDGRYVVSNRDYKPLGIATFTNYEEHPATRSLALTEKMISQIDHRGIPSADGSIFLYDDSCIPTGSKSSWDAYAARLAVLAKVKVTM